MNPPTSEDIRWLACHTKPRCEKKFAALLTALGMEHYLPLTESVRDYGPNGVRRHLKPLFPGYVFAHVPVPRQRDIYQQQFVVRTLTVENEGVFLQQLEQVKALLASGLSFTLKPLFAKGRTVRVTSGPLRGAEGVVHEMGEISDVIVKVDVIQQGLLVKIPLSQLKALP